MADPKQRYFRHSMDVNYTRLTNKTTRTLISLLAVNSPHSANISSLLLLLVSFLRKKITKPLEDLAEFYVEGLSVFSLSARNQYCFVITCHSGPHAKVHTELIATEEARASEVFCSF